MMAVSLGRLVDPLREDHESLRSRVERELCEMGLSGRVFRVFPPYDSDGMAEALLLADDGAPYTVYLPSRIDDEERLVQAGW